MYYSEKWINGRLMFKNSPDGEWQEFTQEMYAKRVIEREVEIIELQHFKDQQEGVYTGNDDGIMYYLGGM